TILITSQTALSIPGEHLYPLLPLPTPAPNLTTAGAILRSDAVALFVARARAVKPTLVIDDRQAVTIAEICRRLDGLPLAIELAAARMNILSPDALLARLTNRLQVLGGERRGVPDRLRTMRHAIAWSYELLTPPEQWLFRRLAVFAGGFPLDAVEALYQADPDGRDAWTVLSTLVDHSLVQAVSQPSGDVRFLVLETLRDYGLEQLEALGEVSDARFAHATWVRDLAEAAELRMQGNDQERWLNRLEPEWENVRAAAEWALASGHAAVVLRTFSAIRRFCTARGHVSEAREFLDRALAAMGDDQSVVRCRSLIAAGNLAEDQGDLDIAQALCTQARALAVELGDKPNEALALIGLGYVAQDRGDFKTALAVHSQAETLARELDGQHILGTALGNLASVSYFQGNLADAQRYWEEASRIFNAIGDHLTEALAVGNLGAVATEQGEFDLAERLQQRAL
ncbi:MAG: tetratricopeptide repeat protein, partial [Chloroflexota bacterium]|nr:tetratricopeptide repeat protein [Chloroflexota bacterium]